MYLVYVECKSLQYSLHYFCAIVRHCLRGEKKPFCKDIHKILIILFKYNTILQKSCKPAQRAFDRRMCPLQKQVRVQMEGIQATSFKSVLGQDFIAASLVLACYLYGCFFQPIKISECSYLHSQKAFCILLMSVNHLFFLNVRKKRHISYFFLCKPNTQITYELM